MHFVSEQVTTFKSDLKRHQKVLSELNAALKKDSILQDDIKSINNKIDSASENFGKMASSSSVANKSLSSVYSSESMKSQNTLNNIFSNLRNKKNTVNNKISELEENINRAESELQDINSGIDTACSAASDWRNVRRNASYDMEYYRRKMYEEE